MVLTKRERYVFLATAAVVVLLGADRLVLSPLLSQRAQSRRQLESRQEQLTAAQRLLDSNRQLQPRWKAMQPTLKAGPAEAESQILHAVRNAAQESGLEMTLVRPERLTETGRMPQFTFQAVGTGSMARVSRFLWNLQMTEVPVRVTELQISSRREGADDLSVEVRFSTLCRAMSARPALAKATAVAARTGEGVE